MLPEFRDEPRHPAPHPVHRERHLRLVVLDAPAPNPRNVRAWHVVRASGRTALALAAAAACLLLVVGAVINLFGVTP